MKNAGLIFDILEGREFVVNKKRFIIAVVVCLAGVVFDIIIGYVVHKNLYEMTVQQLFVYFALIPLVLSFTIPFLSMLVYNNKRTMIPNFSFSLFLYLFNYIVIDSFFTPEVLTKIQENSGVSPSEISVSSSTDVSNMISTAITLFALCATGTFLAKLILNKQRKYKLKSKR